MFPLLPRRRAQPQASKQKVFVGISGGVDSAVCAALLTREGWEVTGVFIKIQIEGYPCPAAQDRVEAMRVAAHLDIPFVEVDLSREYEREVFDPSIEEFKKGNTPNPDTLCNEKIKFGVFFEFCMSRGADFVATGHYARIASADSLSQKSSGRLTARSRVGFQTFAQENQPLLLTSTDANKDQSYFLWAVPEAALAHTLFPVGSMSKPRVRALARAFGLPNAARPDSQGLCFLGDISVQDMLGREVRVREGSVLDESGTIVGVHAGALLYTLGERHGFSLFPDVPHDAPRYVVAKDVKKNTITVSTDKFPRDAHKTHIALERANWLGEVEDGPCEARYRYRQALIPAVLQKNSAAGCEVTLEQPHYVPLGQSLVLYRGEWCLGGGVIADATLM